MLIWNSVFDLVLISVLISVFLFSISSTVSHSWYDIVYIQAQDVLEESQQMMPVSCDGIDLVNDISDDLAEQGSKNSSAKELRMILKNVHFLVRISHIAVWQ